MKITELLDRPIAYHRCFVTLTGSVKAAVMLSQAIYWQPRAKQDDGYWYKTIEEWQEETGLTDHEQRTARRDCAKYLLSDLRGVPAQLFYKVDEEALEADLLHQTVRTSSAENAELVGHKPQNIKRNAETTSENNNKASLSEQEIKEANQKVDKIIEYAKEGEKAWKGRDYFRDNHLVYADWWNAVSNQICTKKYMASWQKAFTEWQDSILTVFSLQEAYDSQKKWRVVSDPNMITKDAIALQALGSKSTPAARKEGESSGYYA